MKMKTSELTGAALDWAVARCEALSAYTDIGHDGWGVYVDYSDDYCQVHYTPTLNWGWGGPIIERELMQISGSVTNNEPRWFALRVKDDKSGVCKGHGPTPLIAALRCYVASKLGDDIEIPEELK